MGALQPLHLVVIMVIVLVIFGAGRLGDVGGALGKGVKDFRAHVEDKDKDKTKVATAARAGFCPGCGTPAPEAGGQFCTQCGRELPAS